MSGQNSYPAYALLQSDGTWLELPTSPPEIGASLVVVSQISPGRFQLGWSVLVGAGIGSASIGSTFIVG